MSEFYLLHYIFHHFLLPEDCLTPLSKNVDFAIDSFRSLLRVAWEMFPHRCLCTNNLCGQKKKKLVLR